MFTICMRKFYLDLTAKNNGHAGFAKVMDNLSIDSIIGVVYIMGVYLDVLDAKLDVHRETYIKPDHSRGSIVEPQGLHQNGLNSLPYNGLKTTIISVI